MTTTTPSKTNETFEGRDVASSTAKVSGLSKAIAKASDVDGVRWRHGDRVHLLISAEVDDVGFDRIDGTTKVVRVHGLAADVVAIVSEEFARETIERTREAIRLHEDEKAGVQALANPAPGSVGAAADAALGKVKTSPELSKVVGAAKKAAKPVKKAAVKRASPSTSPFRPPTGTAAK